MALKTLAAGSTTLAMVLTLTSLGAGAQGLGTPPAPPAPGDPAPAEAKPGANANRVEIQGRRSTTDERRLSSAAKIVVGREEIEQHGDLTLGEVLKRLPSVTIGGRPGRGGGQIRMRGMGNGYTLILVDGERTPPGFSIDQIPPDQVERIEIYRAPTAEIGGRAVAGAINIVLREPLRLRGDELRLGLSHDRRGVRPNASWTRNEHLGERANWTLNLSMNGSDLRTATDTRTEYVDAASGLALRTLQRHNEARDERRSAHLGGRVHWSLGEVGSGEHISLQPFLSLNQGRGHSDGRLTATDASAPYDTAASEGSNHSAHARLSANGRLRLGDGTRVEWRGAVGGMQSSSVGHLAQRRLGVATPVLLQDSRTDVRDRSWSLGLKLLHGWMDTHQLVGGIELEGVRRSEAGLQRAEVANASVSGMPVALDVDGDLQARTRRVAVYVQDDWAPAPRWAANLGLRWEQIDTTSATALNPVANTGHVLTPMGHLVWRFNDSADRRARDQLRLSLTRSYRPPSLGNLTAVPRFNTTDPVPGGNTASTPDRAGNPDLKPELAQGLDLAMEHYFGNGGVVSVSAFARRIQQLIRNLTAQEAVPWATVPRWVNRPRNIGDARTWGIELDAKARLVEAWPDAPAALHGVALRGNLGLYRSRVSGIPGPDNRIDQQPRLSLNAGADWKLPGLPITVGAHVNAVPAYAIQQSELQRSSIGATRVVDGFLQWTLSPQTRLRLSLSNAVPRDYLNTTRLQAAGQVQTTISNGPTYRVFGLRLETKL